MADDTQTPPVRTEPEVKVVRWCHWHQNMADDTTLIDAHERNSGPPYLLYACPPCMKRHDLKPM
ncbi:hypothetical protein [Streptomyces sp. NPDC055210]